MKNKIVLINGDEFLVSSYDNIGPYIRFDFVPTSEPTQEYKVPWTSVLHIRKDK